jgi:DNA-binding GntR family transcriptional regulator
MYDQVAADIAADITSGAMAPGARLPTEVELAAQYQVSRVTIRRAVKELSGHGLVVVSHGRGTFVTERPSGEER